MEEQEPFLLPLPFGRLDGWHAPPCLVYKVLGIEPWRLWCRPCLTSHADLLTGCLVDCAHSASEPALFCPEAATSFSVRKTGAQRMSC